MRCLQARWWALPDLRHHLPGGLPHDVFKLGGGCSQIFGTAPRGPTTHILELSGGHSWTSGNYDPGGHYGAYYE
jgi:hypothetical protein